jgi:hypothetical protein
MTYFTHLKANQGLPERPELRLMYFHITFLPGHLWEAPAEAGVNYLITTD